MTLYSRVARWELRGNVLRQELFVHSATCKCETCSMCQTLIELSRSEKPAIEKLFVGYINLNRKDDEING